ncbi:Inter-alpha-trypsin inhibitor heavy chain H3 [Labeo rohita]|uniref:Inter-alpha-trypsin inhibitor heavy chain H3 n=1 Tax=Labeo rohita TaxID=84645 RepID=A0ABQ8M8F2_LABRO|nr:Inter-alpha-trypsin inhibitor heavy chain H3 [Labeo rohita]
MDKVVLRLTFFGLLFTCFNLAAEDKKQDIDIYSFQINSTVTSRYATTVITSRVANLLNQSQEIHFEVKIPKDAFISQFRIAVGRTLEDFKTSVTVAAFSKVTFELTYEELLKRRLGKYELLINAQPMQPVADFKIDIHIHENPGISFLEVKGGLSTKDLTNAVTTIRADKDAWVKFYPTRDQQTRCDDCSKNGLNGNLIIMYDVQRQKRSGDLTVSNGYFVHYFAPTDIQRIPKNVVFIIDQSGSMRGKKIEQTRLAMLRILSDIAEDDRFGLITFSGHIETWKPELLKATKGNVEEAKAFVKGITSETNPVKIQKNVKEAIGGKFPLYSLGFGFDVSFEFLNKLSLENKGVARRIYEDSDADLQLQGFYEEVAIPLLTDVQLNYQGVGNLTQSTFNQYYNGDLDIPQNKNFIKRLWAFLTVKQLLEKMVLLEGLEKDNAKKEALALSLKYKFVTPLTSLVVTKPQDEEMQVAHKPKEEKKTNRLSSGITKTSGSSQNVRSIRILKSSGNARPLCYNVPLAQKVRLLQNVLSEFTMNGQHESFGGEGFSQITIHYKANHHLLLSTSEINYTDGQETVKFSWEQDLSHHERENVSLILRSNEMDITMGNIRAVILLHKKDSDIFLWPAIWQQPKDVSLMGILGEADISYEEIPGSQTPTLKVMVKDYRLASAPVVGCWLVPFQAVTQQKLADFTIMMDRAALRLILLGVFLISAASDPKENVDIYSFYINSTVTSRYATTVITSRVANTLNESQEIQFEVKIPKNAFISKFRMTIEGKTYDGVVKEKEEAQQQYNQAVSRGQSAGLIKSVGRTLEDFKTSVTVAAFSKVTFELTYEELLKRRLGKYELLINAQPMQPVADFKMDVHIQEKPGISFLEVKGDLSTGDLANAIKTTRADKDAWVTFYPTRDQQTKCKSCGENGLNGNLLITYDVERRNPKGEVMVSNGYFVHYFAPSDVPRIPKNVVFIIDQSGSMHGRKIEQTRLALLRILSDLDEDDHFGLITFDSEVSLWKRELLKATETNLENAKSFVKEIRDRGGETNIEKIMANVKGAIGTKFPLYCLGFGYDVNFDFLTKMSLENGGVARRIYEDSDADLQLQGFYDEVAVPLLTDIQLKYPGGTNLTKTSFGLYFNGSEIVVSGQITDNSVESFTTEVIAVSKGSNVMYQDTIMTKDPSDVPPENEDFMQRLWAYLTVQQLLERQVLLKGQEKEDKKKEALKLSLKYKFVTPLTSMVVTKPQEGDVEVADKPKEGETPPRPPRYVGSLPVNRVRRNRFVLSVDGQSKPLCFDVPVPYKLRLLRGLTSQFSMNGESMPGQNGFHEIAIHYKTNHHLTINTTSIRYTDGQNHLEFLWSQRPTQHITEDVSLILRHNEIDVTMGNISVSILLHTKKNDKFLWPVVLKQPQVSSFCGIFGEADITYEEIPGSQTPTLKLKDQEVKTSWVMTKDYRIASAPEVGCWLVPFQAVAQRKLSDFAIMMDRAALRLILLGVFIISVTSVPIKKKENVDIYSFYINSTVTSRFTTTVITSRVANKLNESQEIQFEVKIPKNAFISKFRMTIEGKTYDGVVKGKEEAQQQYSRAVSQGQSAGLIKSVGRTLEDFKTSVTVAAFSKVTFELTYEELLQRRLGRYELLINAQPMQPVADFKLDVHIQEKPGISFLEVKGDLSTDDLANAIKTTRADKDAWVTFYPTRDQQTKCKSCGENGMNGDLLITYDVERKNPKGEVVVSNGYFVHYFAPSDVPRIAKNVVFVIDRSGSMHGRKIEQTRLALLRILSDLDEDDHFGLITFDSEVSLWKRELLKATETNLENAKSFVKEIRDRGGETNIQKIMANVKGAIGTKFPLYCLGFGYDVNFDFLTKMSLENSGVARRIYEDSDADLQLQGFYDEVAVPLLTDIQLKYPGGTNLTKTSFGLYFNGSEIVVSGQITDNSVESFTTEVIAVSRGSNVMYQDTIMTKDPSDVPPENEDFMQRLWAYLTVKQLLERQVLLKGQEQEDAKKEALKLSLKYQFVTPLTSMVVTKPQEGEVEVADKPKEGETPPRPPETGFVGGGGGGAPRFGLQGERGFVGNKQVLLVVVVLLLVSVCKGGGQMPMVHEEKIFSVDSVRRNRFVLSVDGQSKPLCFDVPVPHNLILLEDSASGFSMNGDSMIGRKGFREIAFHYKTNNLAINTRVIKYHDGPNKVEFLWSQEPTQHNTENVSLILRSNEIDVTMGNIRVIILLHKEKRHTFLWPAVQQQPKDGSLTGILGKTDASYEEIQGSQTPTLKINDQEVNASWEDVTDYRRSSKPVIKCWLVSFYAVMQKDISDFITAPGFKAGK